MNKCFTCSCPIATGKKHCQFCDKLYFKDEILRESKGLTVSKKQKQKQPQIRTCKTCETSFNRSIYFVNYCSDKCTPKKLTNAEKWLAAKPKTSNGMDSNAIAYAFFRPKYGVKSIYRTCIG